MAIAPAPTPTYTAADYLEREVKSEIRSEFRHGEIVEMTGGTPNHNEIVSILNALLRIALRGQPYSIFVTDQRLGIPECNMFTYPDTMVVPKPLELLPGRKDTILNPVVIAEVLSDSTEGYDRGDKFAAYRTIESLQDYLLVDQKQARVELYSRAEDKQWLLTEYCGLEATVELTAVPVAIPLSELYEGVDLG